MKNDILRKLTSARERYAEIEKELSNAGASAGPDVLKTLGKEFNLLEEPNRLFLEHESLTAEIENCRKNIDSEPDPEMRDLYSREIENLERKLASVGEAAEKFYKPGEAAETRPVILEIRQGTGGNEAALFAGDLFRMYTRYAENKGWKYEMINSSPSSLGGFKEVIVSIRGDGAYNRLRYESGVHRVQRIPITESGGRIHTSAATVAILIEPDEVDIHIDNSELKVDTYRAQGAGGQHVNKTDSAIRITHLPTGITVECQDERSQHQNRAKALRLLRARLLLAKQQEQQNKLDEERRNQVGSGDRSERIRTYNFPQNRVTDHRCELTLYRLDAVVEGILDVLLDPLLEKMTDLELDDPARKAD